MFYNKTRQGYVFHYVEYTLKQTGYLFMGVKIEVY